MALSSGDRLGSYEILSAIGAGGMGEVYRARDTRLKRDVAVKVLPDGFAADPERLARFQRARLVSSFRRQRTPPMEAGISSSSATARCLRWPSTRTRR
jgi:serine/threonine protein kinase